MDIQPILLALRRSKIGAILVAAQVALTLAIIANSLFVVKTRLDTAGRATGVDEEAVFELFYGGAGKIEDRAAMMARDLETLRAIPGVASAADINSIPLGSSGSGRRVTVDPKRPEAAVIVCVYMSGASMIETFGLEIVEGRDFDPSEIREIDARASELDADSVILSRYVARRLFPDGSALGKIVYRGVGERAHPMRVVGVVDTLMTTWRKSTDEAYASILLPIRVLDDVAHYAVRAEPRERARVMAAAEKALGGLRADRVMIFNRTMGEIRKELYHHERSGAGMLIAVTISLLLVTASGIVGVASLWVNQRRKQIGVRRALGARRRDIVRYFLTENILITTTGLIAGAILAIGLNQLLVSHVALERLPIAYVFVGMIVLWALGVAAVLGPAWRASSVPPAIATRSA